MQCDYYDAGRCRSCTVLEVPYAEQVRRKAERAQSLLAQHEGLRWLPVVTSADAGFRNKAKMVVGGTAARPTLGILDEAGHGVDLRECALHTPAVAAALPTLARFVTRAGLQPYDVPRRRGELKHVLVTASSTGELMIRFVLRSTLQVPAVRSQLSWLREALPAVAVVSVNLQGEHKAILEGPQEIVLTRRTWLPFDVGEARLRMPPGAFAQTNTGVAAALYRQVADWTDSLAPTSVWDLYCGVGGFALHVAAPGRDVLGVEVSEQAIASARASAEAAYMSGVRFRAGDATAFATTASTSPDLVIVNPPRRGLGADLTAWLEASPVPHVVYSSCNPVTLAKDLAAMPSLHPRTARLFDMFPNTEHCEVAVVLSRSPSAGSGGGCDHERDAALDDQARLLVGPGAVRQALPGVDDVVFLRRLGDGAAVRLVHQGVGGALLLRPCSSSARASAVVAAHQPVKDDSIASPAELPQPYWSKRTLEIPCSASRRAAATNERRGPVASPWNPWLNRTLTSPSTRWEYTAS